MPGPTPSPELDPVFPDPAAPEEAVIPVADADVVLPPERVSLAVHLMTLFVIVVPFLGLVAAPFLLWGWGFSWSDLGLLAGLSLLTGLGITVGYHRLFTHRSFETYSWVKVIFAALGSMALQGPVIKWVALHRRHHQHSDRPGDPHSPHGHGSGVLGLLAGAWHAHVGWLFMPDPPGLDRYTPDLKKSAAVRVASALFPAWAALGLVVPAVLGGLLTLSWTGVATGVIWGGLVRVFLVHHVTWSINSACHLWGFRPYKSTDSSRNNVVFGILGLGEGWHNAHHAFPTSARHGLSWWQVDVSYWVIRVMSWLRLAWDVRVPSRLARAHARNR